MARSSALCLCTAVIIGALLLTAPNRTLGQTAAAKDDPAVTVFKQGQDAMAAHHYDDAYKAFKKASDLRHGDCSDCFLEMASAELRLGQLDDAVKNCDKAISCAPDDTRRLTGHGLKGNILENMPDPKNLRLAESEYRAALKLAPNNATMHFNLGDALLREGHQEDGVAELNNFLRLAPNDPNAKLAQKLIANPKRAGDPIAPAFTVQTLDGQQISLDQLAGKVLVMDFWATWCGPCRESVPELKALTKKYPSSELALISFSADKDQKDWKEFVSKHDMDWPQYWDSDGRIRSKFGVTAFPTYLVIDQEGFIRERIVGLNPQLTVVGRLKDTLKSMLE